MPARSMQPWAACMSRTNGLTGPKRKSRNIVFRLLGPDLVTGAADDDPSGIATYSQAGAQIIEAIAPSCIPISKLF